MALKQRHASPCDNKCGARSKLHRVKFRGRTLDLCMDCMKALRTIQQDAENAAAIEAPTDLVAFPQGIEYNPPQ